MGGSRVPKSATAKQQQKQRRFHFAYGLTQECAQGWVCATLKRAEAWVCKCVLLLTPNLSWPAASRLLNTVLPESDPSLHPSPLILVVFHAFVLYTVGRYPSVTRLGKPRLDTVSVPRERGTTAQRSKFRPTLLVLLSADSCLTTTTFAHVPVAASRGSLRTAEPADDCTAARPTSPSWPPLPPPSQTWLACLPIR